MAVTPIKQPSRSGSSLDEARALLGDCAHGLVQYHHLLSRQDALQFVLDVEQVSKVVDHLQVLAARIADQHGLAAEAGGAPIPSGAMDEVSDPGPASPTDVGGGSRTCADFLRETLGISRTEARRRLTLAAVVLPSLSPTGNPVPPLLGVLGEAVGSFVISGRAASVVAHALERVRSFATPDQLENMEHHLTRQATETDEDILRILARRWEGVLDQDGQEPTDKVLRARQGVFLKGRRHGLHLLEIGATDEQFEQLATVINAAANPRGSSVRADHPEDDAGPGSTGPATPGTPDQAAPGAAAGDAATGVLPTASGPTRIGAPGCTPGRALGGTGSGTSVDGSPTRAQQLLEGLVSACRIALSTSGLPATGGHRPQVMVTIDYKDLIGETERAGDAVFSEQVSARNIRRIACDADIIPLVLSGNGQVLDVGRAQRLFPPHLRRALVARDKGCAFPDCSIPANWCEAHHLTPWSRGGSTSIDNGVLLCSRHHHVIHQDTWTVESRGGIPWFTPPVHQRRTAHPRRNLYWQAGSAVRSELDGAADSIPTRQRPVSDEPGIPLLDRRTGRRTPFGRGSGRSS
ncbi:HNH endonuclease signature motif containing protein [Arthrobacter sp. B0490]|uniref:HNH endonuclease signature motif containing protein n=1 Tax=Arthrobacter sp. B0490 TaxID=2058891 RepID=UPI000CE36224|nr:HNH endonuclease signature motif containing protein [Arthrobacter sp. B0490]